MNQSFGENRSAGARQFLCAAAGLLLMLASSGCAPTTPRWIDPSWNSQAIPTQPQTLPQSSGFQMVGATEQPQNPNTGSAYAAPPVQPRTVTQSPPQTTYRGQDPGYQDTQNFDGFSDGAQSTGPPTRFAQYPTGSRQDTPQTPGPLIGAPNEPNPYLMPDPPMGNNYQLPPNFADIDVMLTETQTGRMTFGAAFNSNSGLVGQIIIDERNFDLFAFPRSFRDIANGTAFRGAGQGFRLELVPGSEVQRYVVSFTEPYLFQSQISFSASGYMYDRRYFDWDEQRLGGQLSLGYRLNHDLSISVGTRLENVDIHDPRVNTSPQLNSVLGDSELYIGQVSLINDTRDHPFMASQGSYLEMSFFQGFGDFDYPRADVEYRKYFLIYQRPDFSGRHTLRMSTRAGFSGAATPVFENYFAGGFATMRGFDLRGASPIEGGVRVGGQFQWLNTVEYMFPITADDMFKGVVFCDFGTVEEDIALRAENFRVAPGFGFRVHMPFGGAGGAPLAFDFAFPVASAVGDDEQIFSFYMGMLR